MSNINNILAGLSFKFDNPLWLLVLIPGVIFALIPYFRIRKDKRRTRERIVSMILHLVILLLASFVLAGFTIREEQSLKNDQTIILVDVSRSNYDNSEYIANYINQVVGDSDKNAEVGVVVFGAGEPQVYKPLQSRPKVSVQDIYKYYDDPIQDEEGFIMVEGTDMARAISFAATQFDGYEDLQTVEKPLAGCRIVLLSDGIETDGNATSAAGQVASLGATIDAVYFAPKDYSETNEVQLEDVEIQNKTVKPNVPIEANIKIKSRTFGEGAQATFTFSEYSVDNKGKEVLKPLKTKDGDKVVDLAPQTWDITSAEETYTTSFLFDKAGVHTIKVEMTTTVEEETDLKENNVYFTYVVITDNSNKVLIIDGSANNAGTSSIKPLVEEIKDAAGNQAYEVDVVNPRDVGAKDLYKYGEVILVNVNSTGTDASYINSKGKLPQGFDAKIKNYAKTGGVMVMGGENTYYYGGMATDNFNDILPIQVKPKPNTQKEIVFLIDRSSGFVDGDGSEAFRNQYGKTRLQVVQEAMMQALTSNSFSPRDSIGIIYFGGNKNTPIKANDGKMMQAGNIVALKRAIELKISGITGGKEYLGSTEWRHALEAAVGMLQSTSVGENQHIILITDGAPKEPDGESSRLGGYPDGGWKYYGPTLPSGYSAPGGVPERCYTDYLYDSKNSSITTSVINVGMSDPVPASYMEKMVTASKVDGKQHYYYTESADQIFNAVTKECKNIPVKLINKGEDLTDTFLRLNSEALEDIVKDEQIPELKAFNGVSAKDGVATLIETSRQQAPIYAEWDYGSGKVGALMTDLTSNEWGESLIAPGSKSREMFKYLIKNCFIGSTSGLKSDMVVEFTQKNFTTNILINGITNNYLAPDENGNGSVGSIEAYYHSPDENIDPSKKFATIEESINYLCPYEAEDYQYDTMVYAAGSFTSDFQMMKPGLYVVTFYRTAENGASLDNDDIPYQYVTFSYSDEYDTYYDAEKSLATLQDICNSAKGKVYYYGVEGTEQNIFSSESQYTSRTIDPVVALMLVALILFILDVCARKFHFLWPHEWFKKKDKAR